MLTLIFSTDNFLLTYLFDLLYNVSKLFYQRHVRRSETEDKNMARVFNFSAGPSMLPESVLNRAAAEMLDYQGSGQSVMEMSHRSKIYESIIFGA